MVHDFNVSREWRENYYSLHCNIKVEYGAIASKHSVTRVTAEVIQTPDFDLTTFLETMLAVKR